MAEFRVRARTVDMLGRQQIAGLPTAISELFKNAHDAYAGRVEVDYVRKSRIFLLRDDGLGMSHSDFVERWLTLGTESKLTAGFGIPPPPADPEQTTRQILGEKGIGRLAIATIGPQVLVLTRARVRSDCDQLVAAFIHWGVFGLPGVDLSDVRIPTLVLPGGTLPSQPQLAQMVQDVYANVLSLPSGPNVTGAERIISDLAAFDLDPAELYARLPAGPTLLGDGSGTHFIIHPAEETLADDIDSAGSDDAAPPLIKVLVGFANTMTPGQPPPTITARFRDHSLDDTVNERIAGSAFFTPEEFEQADHHVSGRFDEYGQFRGSVTVYGRDSVEYLLPWPEAGGAPLFCGPVEINFAYVQGEARATKLAPETHARLMMKLNKIGGLYVYRDGIRVLPYGNSDYDFLNIERRRTKSASYYFFSYRRIFGVIDITREHNPNLVEKAGREGFRENRAYRQLKQLLERFFVQLAAEFFREGGLMADDFIATRTELEKSEALRRKRSRQVRVRRAAFMRRLDAFFEEVHARAPEKETAEILDRTDTMFGQLIVRADGNLAKIFLDIETSAESQLMAVDERYRVPGSQGFGLTKQLRRDWDAYRVERKRLEQEVLRPAVLQLRKIVERYARRLKTQLDHRRRLNRTLMGTSDIYRRRTTALQRDTKEEMKRLHERVLTRARRGIAAVENAIRVTVADLERIDTNALDGNLFEELRVRLEGQIATVGAAESSNLERLREQLRVTATEDGLEQTEITDAMEEELEALREKENANLQLAQLGMAISVIHHEFASTILGVRNGLRQLKPWANANRQLERLYLDIRSNFDHLDGYLTLFTPLDRRLQRHRIRIAGAEVAQFLSDLFADRLRRHHITLVATPAFRDAGIVGFPSSFYPCFVNLVDNAIFWVGSIDRDKVRRIELDTDGGDLLVTDTGPGIGARDSKAIFEMGFTRRPGGRGMGLYLAMQSLRQNGYELTLDPAEEGRGARFRISSVSLLAEEGKQTAAEEDSGSRDP